jgi:hypothetical protein
MGASPDTHGSLPVVPLIADKRYYGEGSGVVRGRVRCRARGTGDLRFDGLGCQNGFGWVAEPRETGKRPGKASPSHLKAIC